MVSAHLLTKKYTSGDVEFSALKGVSFSIQKGEYAAIMGPSGSGKSTLMHLIGCLDTATGGNIIIDGTDVSKLNDIALATIRNQKIGFVFQQFHLLRKTSALENVSLPLLYAGINEADRDRRARTRLVQVGLSDKINNIPSQLSGGEQQRVAIARALVNNPAILLADEPTGNLDSTSGAEVLHLFDNLHRDGATIILVTHDPNVARHAKRTLSLKDGQLIRDTGRKGSRHE